MNRLHFIKSLAIGAGAAVATTLFGFKTKESDADRLERMLNNGEPVINQKFILDRDVRTSADSIRIEKSTITGTKEMRWIISNKANVEIHYNQFNNAWVRIDWIHSSGNVTHNWVNGKGGLFL
jgi:hypothetical protein